MKKNILTLLKIVVAQFIVSLILVAIAAFVTYKISSSETVIKSLVIAIYAIAGIVGGFIIGKTKQERKFLWGIVAGGIYIGIILIVSLAVNGQISNNPVEVIPSVAAAVLGGMAGGMFS